MSKLEELSEDKMLYKDELYREIDINLSAAKRYFKSKDFETLLWILKRSIEFTKDLMKELEEKEDVIP